MTVQAFQLLTTVGPVANPFWDIQAAIAAAEEHDATGSPEVIAIRHGDQVIPRAEWPAS
jgi:hypothetical protein